MIGPFRSRQVRAKRRWTRTRSATDRASRLRQSGRKAAPYLGVRHHGLGGLRAFRFRLAPAGEDQVEDGGDRGDLYVEALVADVLEAFLAAPGRPLRLRDAPVAVEHGGDLLEVDPAVVGDGLGRGEQKIVVDVVDLGEADDVDVVPPAGAGGPTLQDGDALLGKHGFGRVAEHLDVVTEHARHPDHLRRRNDGVSSGDVPGDLAAEAADRDVHPHAQTWVLGLFADLVDVQAPQVELDAVVSLDRGDVVDHLGDAVSGD